MKLQERLGCSLISAFAADLSVAAACEWIGPPPGPHHWWSFLGFALLMLVGVLPAWLLFALGVAVIAEPTASKAFFSSSMAAAQDRQSSSCMSPGSFGRTHGPCFVFPILFCISRRPFRC